MESHRLVLCIVVFSLKMGFLLRFLDLKVAGMFFGEKIFLFASWENSVEKGLKIANFSCFTFWYLVKRDYFLKLVCDLSRVYSVIRWRKWILFSFPSFGWYLTLCYLLIMWLIFCGGFCRMSVEKYPNNPMLGRREIVNGKVVIVLLFLAMSFCGFVFSFY